MCSGFALTAFCYKHGATVQIRSKPEIDRHLSEVRFPALWAGAWANGCVNGWTGALNGCMFFASISDWCVCAFVEQWLVRGNIILLAVRQSCENYFNSVHVWHACNIFVCLVSCFFLFVLFYYFFLSWTDTKLTSVASDAEFIRGNNCRFRREILLSPWCSPKTLPGNGNFRWKVRWNSLWCWSSLIPFEFSPHPPPPPPSPPLKTWTVP